MFSSSFVIVDDEGNDEVRIFSLSYCPHHIHILLSRMMMKRILNDNHGL